MIGQKGIIILIVAVAAALGLWFGVLRQESAPAPEFTPDAAAPVGTTDTRQPAPDTTARPEPSADPAATQADSPGSDAPAAYSVDTGNWICSAWQDEAGNIVTTGPANNDTCTQWTIKRGAASE